MIKTFKPLRTVARPTPKVNGFRASVASGLILPEPLSRPEQVWTREEWKLLERTSLMLDRHGVELLMQCRESSCHETPLEAQRLPSGDFRLRCAHLDRVMRKAF